jgi:hypothetical protein
MSFDLQKTLERLRLKAEAENRKMITSEELNKIRRQQLSAVIEQIKYLVKTDSSPPTENDVLPFPIFERLVVADSIDLSQLTLAESFKHVFVQKVNIDTSNLFVRGVKGDLVCRLTPASGMHLVAHELGAGGAACYANCYVPGPVEKTRGAICFVRGNPSDGDAIVIQRVMATRGVNLRSYIATVTRTSGVSPLRKLLMEHSGAIRAIIANVERE